MGRAPDSDEVQTPARIAFAALERLCALSEDYGRIHADRAIVSARSAWRSPGSALRFLHNSVPETHVRAVLRRFLKQLEAKPEIASAAEKWAFEHLRRKARPW